MHCALCMYIHIDVWKLASRKLKSLKVHRSFYVYILQFKLQSSHGWKFSCDFMLAQKEGDVFVFLIVIAIKWNKVSKFLELKMASSLKSNTDAHHTHCSLKVVECWISCHALHISILVTPSSSPILKDARHISIL